jgi:hypothetical protein
MTRLENMIEFLEDLNRDPKREPFATILWHLKEAERELAETRAQRDALVEALDGLMVEYNDRKVQWGSEYLWDKHECAEVIETAREALAAVKGEHP